MDEEIMNLLEVEPEGNEHRDQVAVLVASGQANEMIGIELKQDQVKKKLMRGMLKNTSKDMRLHYPQKLVMLLILKDFLLI